ncbi:alpha/beta hydrolase [Streptomyces sp. XM4193]|uniref:alpha/beta fold hydrolase n=1 Tax=Streptomyces sp. XM4193 TaxID=2929782 RepID=UPI001FFA3AFE|nr:alpha/beta hydrolase [Streptomyces sp. XM4193]MCK1796058.1 alpha/beta hydrolase [Streptomyces sp. XM4193]
MSKPPTLELPEGAHARQLRTPRGEFAAHEAGEPTRGTVLLVPGFTGSKEDFITLLTPVAEAGYRVVAVDGRGQYESAGPQEASGYAQPELAADVSAQCDALGGGVHLLGHSLGGLICRAAVLAEPKAFRSFTVMSSGPASVGDQQQERLKLLLGALPVLDMAAIWQAMRDLDPPEAADAQTPQAVRDFLRRRWMATDPRQLIAGAEQLLSEPDRVDELAALDLPYHVLSGERDYAWPVELMDDMAHRLGARRSLIPGAEHSPAVENPAATAQALLAFWQQH